MKTVAIALAVALFAAGVLAPTAAAVTTTETDDTTDCVEWAVNTVAHFVATGTIRPNVCT